MENGTIEPKLVVIRGYLQKHISHCTVQEGSNSDGALKLTVTYGGTAQCSVQVCSALLSDQHLTSVELRWALKDEDIAGKVLSNERVYLNHETLKTGDTGATARWPRNKKNFGSE
jgi:hypothetical protein